MSEIIYRKINENELNTEIFSNFNRYQQVNKWWRKRNGQWTLENIAFTEQWGKEEYDEKGKIPGIYIQTCKYF